MAWAHSQLPDRARPVEIEHCSDTGLWWQLGKPLPRFYPSVTPSSATSTFDLLIHSLDPWEVELLRQVTLELDPYSLCLDLIPGFRAVSDGPVKLHTHVSFGWVLSSLDGKRLAYGMSPGREQLHIWIKRKHMDCYPSCDFFSELKNTLKWMNSRKEWLQRIAKEFLTLCRPARMTLRQSKSQSTWTTAKLYWTVCGQSGIY